ncbi:hypothetical protein ACQ4PT_023196 [Festuca glaucescens]
MDKIVREEVQEDPDARLKDPDPLKILERPVEEEEDHEEDNRGGGEKDNVCSEEEKTGGGGDTEEEDSDDEGWDEEGDEDDTEEDSDEDWDENGEPNVELSQEWREMVDNNRTPLPVKPLHVLPKVTRACASGYECYHREYWTGITSETASSHPYFRPCSMMQVFSLRLSSPVDHSVNVYGSFSIRDCWEPLPNYLFKRSRDDPAMIPQVSDISYSHELKLHRGKYRPFIDRTNRFIEAMFAVVSFFFSINDWKNSR